MHEREGRWPRGGKPHGANPRGAKPRDSKPRGGKPVTRQLLEKSALAYLERYASSAGNLRRVLLRRVEKSARLHATDRKEGMAWVDDLVTRYAAAGLVDDKKYAEGAASSLRRRGASMRSIRFKLRVKGVDADTADAALEASGGSDDEADLRAAVAFARRRRLGPFGKPDGRKERRMREMAALARGGFSYAIARKVIDAKDEEALADPAD